MDFSIIFQIRTKKFWWMDVIFYFVISLLIATIFTYVIFLVKNNFQRQDIVKETAALQTVGTDQQKEEEASVITYQKKINDFAGLLKNHEFASNVFAFMQQRTMPNIWFKQFSLDAKNNGIQLSGESDDLDAFSRQVATLENENNKKYIKSIGTLSSALGASARNQFNISLTLDQNIFGYLASADLAPKTVSPAEQSIVEAGQIAPETPAANLTTPANNAPAETGTTTVPATGSQTSTVNQSGEKLITSFHLLLNPEVIGTVNQTNFTITLNVPYNTDIKSLTPSMVISPGATVSPAPDLVQDFTNPIKYTVTAQDGLTQAYEAKVVMGAPPLPVAKKVSQSGSVAILVIVLFGIIIVIAVMGFFVWKKIKARKTKL